MLFSVLKMLNKLRYSSEVQIFSGKYFNPSTTGIRPEGTRETFRAVHLIERKLQTSLDTMLNLASRPENQSTRSTNEAQKSVFR